VTKNSRVCKLLITFWIMKISIWTWCLRMLTLEQMLIKRLWLPQAPWTTKLMAFGKGGPIRLLGMLHSKVVLRLRCRMVKIWINSNSWGITVVTNLKFKILICTQAVHHNNCYHQRINQLQNWPQFPCRRWQLKIHKISIISIKIREVFSVVPISPQV